MIILTSLNALIFILLGILHFYWLAGGKWGMNSVIPTKEKASDILFAPSAFATGIVAIGLLLFGLIELGNTNIFSNWIALKYFRWGNLFIAFIFLARAIGDFKYVGFFKRTRNTAFARNDTRYYSPLCLFISVTTAFVSLTY